MIQNKVVARSQDGRMIKGSTNDFMPNKKIYHVVPADSPPWTKPIDVFVKNLKAVSFIKDFFREVLFKKISFRDTLTATFSALIYH
jgi:hypothetical protein